MGKEGLEKLTHFFEEKNWIYTEHHIWKGFPNCIKKLNKEFKSIKLIE